MYFDHQEATRKLSTRTKTYYQYLSPAGRFLEDLLIETSHELMSEVCAYDIIHTPESAIKGWNPRSLMTFWIDAEHTIPTPFKTYNNINTMTSLT